MTRAKFEVTHIEISKGTKRVEKDGETVYEPCEMKTIKMQPVYHNDEDGHENQKFWEATPTGLFEMGVVNAEAVKMFEVGKEYYIDISAAE